MRGALPVMTFRPAPWWEQRQGHVVLLRIINAQHERHCGVIWYPACEQRRAYSVPQPNVPALTCCYPLRVGRWGCTWSVRVGLN